MVGYKYLVGRKQSYSYERLIGRMNASWYEKRGRSAVHLAKEGGDDDEGYQYIGEPFTLYVR